jgi:hypothetical protein
MSDHRPSHLELRRCGRKPVEGYPAADGGISEAGAGGKGPPPPERHEAWYELIDATLQEAKPRLDEYLMMEPARLDEYGRTFLAFADALRRTHNARLAEALAAQRRGLADECRVAPCSSDGRRRVAPTG